MRHEDIGELFPRSRTFRLILTTTFLGALASVVLVGATVEIPRRAVAKGTIEAKSGSIRIYVHQNGTVESLLVAEGERVSAGQVLAQMASDGVTADGVDVRRGQLAALDEQIGQGDAESDARQLELASQGLGLRAKLQGLREQLEMLGGMLSDRQAALGIEDQRLGNLQQLTDRGFYPPAKLGEQKQQVLTLRQDVAETIAAMKARARDIDVAQSEIARLATMESQAQAAHRQVSAKYRMERLTSLVNTRHALVSPVAGIVTLLSIRPGEFVGEGRTAVVITDTHAPLEAEVWIPFNQIGYVQVGQPVSLMLDAFPYDKYGFVTGRVREVARAPSMPREMTTGVAMDAPAYRVRVALNSIPKGPNRPVLVPGSQVSADIVLERRSLFGWILKPLSSSKRWLSHA